MFLFPVSPSARPLHPRLSIYPFVTESFSGRRKLMPHAVLRFMDLGSDREERLGDWVVGSQPHPLHDIPPGFILLWLVVWENIEKRKYMLPPVTAPPIHPYVVFPFTPIIIPITVQARPFLFTFAAHCGPSRYTGSLAWVFGSIDYTAVVQSP